MWDNDIRGLPRALFGGDIPLAVLLVASVMVPFAVLAIGFRILYDSVIPEVLGLLVTGAILAYLRPRYTALWLVGIALGIVLSERVFPARPSIEHVLRYGPPVRGSLSDLLKLCGFPAVGSVLGLAWRWMDSGERSRSM
jgi:hypothetical protein